MRQSVVTGRRGGGGCGKYYSRNPTGTFRLQLVSSLALAILRRGPGPRVPQAWVPLCLGLEAGPAAKVSMSSYRDILCNRAMRCATSKQLFRSFAQCPECGLPSTLHLRLSRYTALDYNDMKPVNPGT